MKVNPKIFTGIAIAGVISTSVLAVSQTPKAIQLIEQKKAELGRPVLTKKETVSAAWKCYIPAAASGVITVTAILTGQSVQAKQVAELALAYGLKETAMRLYSKKVAAEIGPERESAIRSAAGVELMNETAKPPLIPVQLCEGTASDARVEVCFDYISGRTFYASISDIRKAVEDFNSNILKVNGRACLNDLYSCFHNENLSDDTYIGDILGWKIEEKGTQEVVPLITSEITDAGSRIVLDFVNPPQYEY